MAQILIPGYASGNVRAWDGDNNFAAPGDYLFQIESVEAKDSNNGKPQLEIGLAVVDGAATQEFNGTTMKTWFSLTDKAIGRMLHLLNVTGIVPDAEGRFNTDELIGLQFVGEVYEDTYTKVDPSVEGGGTTKTNTKVRRERPATDANEWAPIAGAASAAAAAAPTVAGRAAPAVPRAPVPAPAPAPAPAPVAPAPAPAPVAQPRVAGGTLPRPPVRPAAPRR